jgi:hypothetical protein
MAFETISAAKESELEKSLESPDFDWRQFPMLTGNGTSNNSGKLNIGVNIPNYLNAVKAAFL